MCLASRQGRALIFPVTQVPVFKSAAKGVRDELSEKLALDDALTGKIEGLAQWPRDERPNVPLVFFAFRLMVYLGFAMLGLVALSLWLRKRRTLYESRWFLKLIILATPIGVIAIEAGWVTTEAGRQPWIIYGLLRTAEGVSSFSTTTLWTSLVGLWSIYTLIFTIGAWLFFKLVSRPPMEKMPAEAADREGEQTQQPRRPFSRRDEPERRSCRLRRRGGRGLLPREGGAHHQRHRPRPAGRSRRSDDSDEPDDRGRQPRRPVREQALLFRRWE